MTRVLIFQSRQHFWFMPIWMARIFADDVQKGVAVFGKISIIRVNTFLRFFSIRFFCYAWTLFCDFLHSTLTLFAHGTLKLHTFHANLKQLHIHNANFARPPLVFDRTVLQIWPLLAFTSHSSYCSANNTLSQVVCILVISSWLKLSQFASIEIWCDKSGVTITWKRIQASPLCAFRLSAHNTVTHVCKLGPAFDGLPARSPRRTFCTQRQELTMGGHWHE